MQRNTDRSQSRDPNAMTGSSGSYIRNTWYVALWSAELREGVPVAQTILNEPIVFYRKADGGVAALTDRCPHRFVPLSMGKILGGDRIMCPYHGLEFGPDGSCVHNPHGNGTIPAAARLRSYPVIEKHSLLWIWMGQAQPTPETIPDYSCFDNAPALHVSKRDYLRMSANYEIITDNLLDTSHTSYVHEGILGNADTVAADMKVEQIGHRLVVSRTSPGSAVPGMFKPMLTNGMERGTKWNSMRWDPPSCLLIYTGVCEDGADPATGTGFYGVHLLTPETDRSTHYRFAAVRWNVLTTGEERNMAIQEQLSTIRRFAFEEQDGPVIEAQQRALDASPVPLRPVMLSIDAGPARYRRILDRLLLEDAKMPGQEAPAVVSAA
ncbi:Rieske 2Fe-2S domain-containing protein [Roseomonas sp. BN140053]|uniref:aromatic ring-hydroxylating dioxygenase subunit alpha n=1 Tax=Roseomonas sp. BN140053 TaxID=3391898 RepID=UPI0039E9C4E8